MKLVELVQKAIHGPPQSVVYWARGARVDEEFRAGSGLPFSWKGLVSGPRGLRALSKQSVVIAQEQVFLYRPRPTGADGQAAWGVGFSVSVPAGHVQGEMRAILKCDAKVALQDPRALTQRYGGTAGYCTAGELERHFAQVIQPILVGDLKADLLPTLDEADRWGILRQGPDDDSAEYTVPAHLVDDMLQRINAELLVSGLQVEDLVLVMVFPDPSVAPVPADESSAGSEVPEPFAMHFQNRTREELEQTQEQARQQQETRAEKDLVARLMEQGPDKGIPQIRAHVADLLLGGKRAMHGWQLAAEGDVRAKANELWKKLDDVITRLRTLFPEMRVGSHRPAPAEVKAWLEGYREIYAMASELVEAIEVGQTAFEEGELQEQQAIEEMSRWLQRAKQLHGKVARRAVPK